MKIISILEETVQNMNKSQLIMGGIAVVVINIAASLGVFVKYADMTAYAVSKETYSQSVNHINSRLTNIEKQVSEVNRDIKTILRFYK